MNELIKNNVTIKEEIRNITKDNFINGHWLDKDTYMTDIKMTDNLKVLLTDLIEDDEVDFYAEYWKDENKYRYILLFEDDNILINNLVECDYLNNLLMKTIK